MANPQKGVIGLLITLTIKDQDGAVVNMAGATTKNILLEKPSGAVVTKTAADVTDGTDGRIKYLTIANDIDLAGLWQVQADIAIVGFSGKSNKQAMIVEGNVGE